MENFRRLPMFKDNLDEFNDSREVVQQLMDEYRAATTKDYVNFGNMQSAQVRESYLSFSIEFLFIFRLNKHKNTFIK